MMYFASICESCASKPVSLPLTGSLREKTGPVSVPPTLSTPACLIFAIRVPDGIELATGASAITLSTLSPPAPADPEDDPAPLDSSLLLAHPASTREAVAPQARARPFRRRFTVSVLLSRGSEPWRGSRARDRCARRRRTSRARRSRRRRRRP